MAGPAHAIPDEYKDLPQLHGCAVAEIIVADKSKPGQVRACAVGRKRHARWSAARTEVSRVARSAAIWRAELRPSA